jgi:hypothetical protein
MNFHTRTLKFAVLLNFVDHASFACLVHIFGGAHIDLRLTPELNGSQVAMTSTCGRN